MKLPVSLKIDGTFVLAVGALVGGYLLYSSRGKIIDAINPASQDNVVYKGVNAAVGEENVATGADYLFGAIDLINPFADPARKAYAKQVYFGDGD